MKYIVLYDSVFGNTKRVAEEIQTSLGDQADLFQVNDSFDLSGYDMVIIGSPTRAFRPTPNTLKLVRTFSKHSVPRLAVFDTRMDIEKVDSKFLKRMAKWFGYSNDSIEKVAKKKGIDVVVGSGEFYVTDTEGPLAEGTSIEIGKWVQQIKGALTI